MTRRLLVLNGSIRGREGNTAELLDIAVRRAPPGIEARTVELATYDGTVEALADELRAAHGFLVGTGVYWGSWGSPLQRFLEVMTAFESSEPFVGKPVGVAVTMDSVGGFDVAERLLGVFSTLGCFVPPLTMIVVSRLATELGGVAGHEDVWQAEDADTLIHNLALALDAAAMPWRSWPIERARTIAGPYPAAGPLHLGAPSFLRRYAGTTPRSP